MRSLCILVCNLVLWVTGVSGTVTAAEPVLIDTVIQTGLSHPWDLAFAPDGRMFVSERPGRILIFASSAAGADRLADV